MPASVLSPNEVAYVLGVAGCVEGTHTTQRKDGGEARALLPYLWQWPCCWGCALGGLSTVCCQLNLLFHTPGGRGFIRAAKFGPLSSGKLVVLTKRSVLCMGTLQQAAGAFWGAFMH